MLRLVIFLLLTTGAAYADSNAEARVWLERLAENRVVKDFSLKGRLFVASDQTVPVEVLVKNATTETRTIYRAGTNAVLIVQPVHGEPRYFLRGARPMDKWLGSQFTYYDLGVPFLRWPDPKFVADDRLRGRDCHVVEVRATGQPYAHVKIWIDREYFALLRAEAFNEDENPVKRFAVTSFKRLGEIWIPRAIECATVSPGQALPAQEKSRLEIDTGDYDAKLPAEWFAEEKFGAAR